MAAPPPDRRNRRNRSDAAPERRLPPGVAATAPPSRTGNGVKWLVVAALLVVAFVVVVWTVRRTPASGPAPIVTEPPPQSTGPGVVGLVVQPDDGRAPILDEIDRARRSIDLEVYLLSDSQMIAALERAHDRGVPVRVLLEQHPFGGNGSTPDVYARLQKAGVDVRWTNPAFTFSHVKLFIFDDDAAAIMNLNLTASAFTRNREFAIVTTQPAAVRTAMAIFAADWTRGPEPNPDPLVVSPTNSREALLGLIGGARRSLDIYAEVMRDPEAMRAVEDAARRGVQVRLIMSGQPNDDNGKQRAELAAAGVQVRLLNRLYIHAKMILVDGQRAFVGSQNFTATSLDQNREVGIVVDDPAVLARIEKTFAADFATGKPQVG
ncbi:MAG TPA: phospholipase D-like domain-containing protein [Thermomicrobiales bacterium]|nr:phospholipase D-like domain-containing protein [Thermomicrobiales bacterium]